MESKLRLFAVFVLVIFAVACTPKLIKMYNVHDQPIPHGLTEDQVRKAINIGAGTAGWYTEEASPGSIAATYHIRVHTVTVLISYTEQAYSIDYMKSSQMKVFCTEEDKEENRAKKLTTGGGTCPEVDQPAYIHENYKDWIDELNRGIHSALLNIDQASTFCSFNAGLILVSKYCLEIPMQVTLIPRAGWTTMFGAFSRVRRHRYTTRNRASSVQIPKQRLGMK